MNLLVDSHIKVDNWFSPTEGWTQKFEKPLNMTSMRPSLVHVFNLKKNTHTILFASKEKKIITSKKKYNYQWLIANILHELIRVS